MPIRASDPALERILGRLVRRSFPLLRRVPLQIEWGGEDELLCYGVEDDQFCIWVNPWLRPGPPRALEGGLAHELCHIDADLRLRPYARQLAWARYLQSTCCRIREERATERRVLELGYGPHLLAFIHFAHRLGYSFSREHGLLYSEIARAVRGR
jgi:hypothetical protein